MILSHAYLPQSKLHNSSAEFAVRKGCRAHWHTFQNKNPTYLDVSPMVLL